MLKILLILVVIFLIYYLIKRLKNKPSVEMFSTNKPSPLVLKVIADDYLGIYHEKSSTHQIHRMKCFGQK